MRFRQFPCWNTTIAYITTQYFKWSKGKTHLSKPLSWCGHKNSYFFLSQFVSTMFKKGAVKKVEIFFLVHLSFFQKEVKLKGGIDLRKLSIHLWNNLTKEEWTMNLNWRWTMKALLIFTPYELKTSFHSCPPIFVMQPSLVEDILIYWLA